MSQPEQLVVLWLTKALQMKRMSQPEQLVVLWLTKALQMKCPRKLLSMSTTQQIVISYL